MTVERLATVVGRLTPRAAIAAWGPTAEERRVAALLRRQARQHALRPNVMVTLVGTSGDDPSDVAVDADGAFVVTHVPPGSWEVELHLDGGVTSLLGTIDSLAPGERREVRYDIASLVPTPVHGTVTLDGMPVEDAALELWGPVASSPTSFSAVTTVTHGRYRLDRVLAGEASAILDLNDVTQGKRVLPRPVIVPRDPDRPLDLSFDTHRLRLRLLDEHDAPLAGRMVSLEPSDPTHRSLPQLFRAHTTDDDGWCAFEGLPPWPVVAWLWDADVPPERATYAMPKGRGTPVGEVTAHLGSLEATVTLRVPPR